MATIYYFATNFILYFFQTSRTYPKLDVADPELELNKGCDSSESESLLPPAIIFLQLRIGSEKNKTKLNTWHFYAPNQPQTSHFDGVKVKKNHTQTFLGIRTTRVKSKSGTFSGSNRKICHYHKKISLQNRVWRSSKFQ